MLFRSMERFHRHNFFYFNYTLKGEYQSLSQKQNNKITIKEGELYAGQPNCAHALCIHDNQESIIVGVLIKKETMFNHFLPNINSNFFHFLLDPISDELSEKFIHFRIEDDSNIKSLLKMMIIEYADKKPDTQSVLKPLVLAFLMQINREFKEEYSEDLTQQIAQYIRENFNHTTLKDVAKHFGYNHIYLGSLLHKNLKTSFSKIVLNERMERAVVLLENSSLSIEKIAMLLGYSNSSNFYKAFKSYFGKSPRA